MNDILMIDSDSDNLEKMFDEVKRILPCQRLQIAPEKRQRGDSINYLGYKISQQKFNHTRYRSEEISCKLLMIFKN